MSETPSEIHKLSLLRAFARRDDGRLSAGALGKTFSPAKTGGLTPPTATVRSRP